MVGSRKVSSPVLCWKCVGAVASELMMVVIFNYPLKGKQWLFFNYLAVIQVVKISLEG